MPSRFPYGISFVKPGDNSTAYTLETSATPSVALGTVFFTASSAITITNFTGGERGKIIIVFSNSNGATTIQNSAGGVNVFAGVMTVSTNYLKYSTTGNYLMQNNESLMFLHNGTDWSQISPSIRTN